MTKEEIFAGESESLEFKVDVSPKTISWMKTIVAFANGNGGRIVFGVSDAPVEIVGFDGAEIFQKIDAITNAIVFFHVLRFILVSSLIRFSYTTKAHPTGQNYPIEYASIFIDFWA